MPTRLKQLDILRGLAILLVLIWHYLPRQDPAVPALLLLPTRLFWSGVDLFFVLSGFLIGGILLSNVDKENYYQVFYLRRMARILPLYLLLVGVFLFIKKAELISNTQALAWNSLPAWSLLTFTQNIAMAQNKALGGPWFDVTWSLAVEEQFYIFLSLLIRNTRKTNLLIVTIGLILLAPVTRLLLPSIVAYLLTFSRADSLMLGVLLALIWQNESAQNFVRRNAVFFRWSFVFLSIGICILNYRNLPLGDALAGFWLALFYFNLIILALISSSKIAEAFFNNKVFEWLGLRSYGIYLLHKPVLLVFGLVLAYLPALFGNLWIGLSVELVVLVMITELSYRFFEKPLIGLGHRLKYRLSPAPAPEPVVDAA